jgi:hypothetical protein
MTETSLMTISRRHLFKAAAAVAGTIGSVALAERAFADTASKAPKSAVGYQGAPKDGQSCAACANFLAPSDCKIVASPVTPTAWCKLFQAKAG